MRYHLTDHCYKKYNVQEVMKQLNAHEDEITFLFLADKQFIFTASKDSSIKAFFSNKTRCDSIQFDKTKSEITNIMILDESHVISLENLR